MTYRRAFFGAVFVIGLLLAARYTGPTRSGIAEMHDSLTVRAYRLGYVQGHLDAQRGVMDPAVRTRMFQLRDIKQPRHTINK